MSDQDLMISNSQGDSTKDKVYPNFSLARKEIANIEPIDYFFAQDLINVFNLNKSQRVEFFHLLMALSQSLREGHTCLPINVIAKTQYGFLSDDTGVVVNHGFVFSDLNTLNDLLTSINTFIGLEIEKLRFGFSYDINTTNIGRTDGVYELSVTYLTGCLVCRNPANLERRK